MFQVGATVTVSIRVFNLGSGVDPTTLTVYILGQGGIRNLTTSRLASSSYASTFQIESGDLAGRYSGAGTDTVWIYANATLDTMAYTAAAQVTVAVSPPSLQMTLSTGGTWFLPGAEVQVNASVSSYGVPVDPSSLSVWGYLQTAYGPLGKQFAIPVTRGGTGRYQGTYDVPADALQDTALSIGGEVSLGAHTAYAGYVYGTIGNPHEYKVWFHARTMTDSYSIIDALIANETGWPVAGANVSLYYPYGCSGNGCPWPRWLSGTTDRLGAASFNLTYPTQPFSQILSFRGNVSVGARNQTYVGLVGSRDAFSPYRELCPTDGLRSYAPGETVRRTYHGDCVPWRPNQTYYYYASTTQGIVANGTVPADSYGNFTVSFTAPSESVLITLRTNLTYLGWTVYHDFVRVADPKLIQISDLAIGRVAQITVGISNLSGLVAFRPYNASDTEDPEYSGWSPEARNLIGESFPAVPGSPFHADLVLPRFLPKDQDYLLTVLLGSSYGADGVYPFAEVVHMANLPPTAAASFSTLNPVARGAITANASSSTDPDGMVVAYEIDWGDGNSTGWSESPEAGHSYSTAGTYTVTVHVQDDTGAQNLTTYTVLVDPTVLGIRASTFYLVTILVLVAAVAGVVALVYLRRRRTKRGGMTQETPGGRGSEPPSGP